VQVGVVARIPDHAVVAGLAEHLIVAIATGEHVVVRAPEQEVVPSLAQERVVAALSEQHVAARATGDDVVACAAEQIGARQSAIRLVECDGVVAALTEDLNEARVRDRRRAAADRHRTAVDEKLARRVAADRDRVVQTVAEGGEDAVGEATGHRLDRDLIVAQDSDVVREVVSPVGQFGRITRIV
jgi:hypothetical protein